MTTNNYQHPFDDIINNSILNDNSNNDTATRTNNNNYNININDETNINDNKNETSTVDVTSFLNDINLLKSLMRNRNKKLICMLV